MIWLKNLWQRFATTSWAIIGLLLLAALLHIGTSIGGGFYADDYVQRVSVVGSEALAERGLLEGIKTQDLSAFLINQFNFFNPQSANYPAMQAFGIIPWWAGEDAMLHFYRPLAAATHFIDYHFWPDQARIMHVISLLWYLFGLAAIYCLYRRLSADKSIALLALLLIILDLSVFQVVTWIASRSMLMVIVFGFFCVRAYHESITDKRWYPVAVFALVLALLSAEGAIGICAYLGAYLFTLDQRPWLKRIVHILPFALITVLWHGLYQKAGFGAYGVDFYLDPGREPLHFLQTALYRLPGNFFELSSGVDFMSGQLRPDIRAIAFAIGGISVLLLLLWQLWPELRKNKTLQFFLLGSCFALVPGLSIALAPRVMILPNVGFAWVLASLLSYNARAMFAGMRRYVANGLTVYTVFMHGLVAVAFALMININAISTAFSEQKAYGQIQLGTEDIADKHVVVVNSLQPFWLAFVAHQLDFQQQALPYSVRLLASSFYPLRLTRLTDNTLRLEGLPAIQLDRQPVDGYQGKEAGHYIYLTWELMGLIRAEREPWQEGQHYQFAEMQITVEKLYQGKPQSLLVTLLKPMDEYRWLYHDWQNKAQPYKTLSLPASGEFIEFNGVFN